MMKTRFSILLLATVLMFACDKKTDEKSDSGIYESTDGAGKVEEKKEEKPAANTSVEFVETEYNFGTVNEGEMVSHSFKFKNTGTHPLVITDARADCGCTVPNPPKEPIQPGQESQIDVKFNSSGKGGQTITKTITVLANTEPSDSKLYIKGTVRGKDEGKPLRK